MLSEKFRRELRQESEKWWSEGLIDAALYEKLSTRYQLDRLEQDASHRFIAILMGLGAILLGLGAITFVAANWQVWSRTFKVLLLLGCFVGVNAAGFYLWRRPTSQPGQQRLGHGLLLLGALLLGANMGLMSQMFHQSGELYELLLIWGLGVAAMAYSLRLTSQAVLAMLLIGAGYLGGWVSWSNWQEFSSSQAIVQHLPLLVSLVFVPLAYWCRSRVLFGLSAIAVAFALVFNLRPLSLWSGAGFASGWIVALAFVLPPALLWSYSDRLWQFSRSLAASALPATPQPFQAIARSLALWFLSITFYCFSFRFWWSEWSDRSGSAMSSSSWDWQPLVDAIALSIVAGLGWLQLRHQLRQIFRVQERAINSGTIAVLLVITAGLFLWHVEVGALPIFGTYGFNVMLFLLAVGLIRDGLALGGRLTFWGGMALLVLGIVTRMLEYNTDLLLKAIVFALCGVGIIAAGLWFERKAKPRLVPSLSKSP
jgi:uncharacterized membrane protein